VEGLVEPSDGDWVCAQAENCRAPCFIRPAGGQPLPASALRCPLTHLPVRWEQRGEPPPEAAGVREEEVGPHDLVCARAAGCAVGCIVRRSSADDPWPEGFLCPSTGLPVPDWIRAWDAPEEVWGA